MNTPMQVLNAEIARRDSRTPFVARPLAPAEFFAVQSGEGRYADIELWLLTADIPDHPTGSSVSRQTLEDAGFFVPATVGFPPFKASGATPVNPSGIPS